jgi:hypothetical protein
MRLGEIWRPPCGCIARHCEYSVLSSRLVCMYLEYPELIACFMLLTTTSDVSRISDISITAYLRNVSPNAPANQGDENANMGNSDLCLGSVRFTPNLESMVSLSKEAKPARRVDIEILMNSFGLVATGGRMAAVVPRKRCYPYADGFQAQPSRDACSHVQIDLVLMVARFVRTNICPSTRSNCLKSLAREASERLVQLVSGLAWVGVYSAPLLTTFDAQFPGDASS